MSTPAQNVPGEFQNTIDLPSGIDQAAANTAQGKLSAAQGKVRSIQARIDQLKKQAGNKSSTNGHDARTVSSAGQLRVAQVELAAAQKAVTSAQNTYYEASGQYDKLLTGSNRDAFLALQSLFNGFGLGSLAGRIYDYVKQGYGADTISILLQDTKEYKTRFAANEARTKAGLPVLSPADYLATESAYRQVLSAAGLPKGFYDNPADFQSWIAADVSPTEIKDRVDLATQAVSQSNPQYRQALKQMYGVGEADLTAYFLDRKRAEPILKKQAAAGAIGAAALRHGFGLNTLDLEGYATMGISADQAEQAYGQISQGFSTMLGLAGRYGDVWNQQLAEQEVFTPGATTGGQESASAKGVRLRSQERALFSGSQGSSVQGLNPGYSQT